jgi:hypothetical protein
MENQMFDCRISDELIAATMDERGTPHPWRDIPADRAALGS